MPFSEEKKGNNSYKHPLHIEFTESIADGDFAA